ncbi:MAG: VOC family protein [Chloracidobacterium sp.]|nr:VOC family protein [Chloracidobacterium sp.]
MIRKRHIILYVRDQQQSTRFYTAALAFEPILNVPGMTEFDLGEGAVLGLMPEAGATRLLGIETERFDAARATPRAEVYLVVDDAAAYHQRAIKAGAVELSSPSARDWGHEAAYSLDPDGHVLAFAKEL